MMRFSALFLAVGCGPVDSVDPPSSSGIQIGEEGDEGICKDVSAPVADGDVASGAMTFTANEFLAEVDPSVQGLFVFADGSDAPLTVTLSPLSEVRWTYTVPRDGIDPALCTTERYSTTVAVSLRAGSLEVDFDAEFWAAWPERPLWEAFVPDAEVSGLEPATLNTAQWDTTELVLSANREEGVWDGYAMWSATSAADPSGRGEDAGTWQATANR